MFKKIILFFIIPIILFFSFPPVNIGFFYIIGLVFLLLIIKDIKGKKLFLNLFISFSFYWFLIFHWLILINIGLPFTTRILIFLGTILLSCILSLICTFPFIITNVKDKSIYLLPLIYASIEFLSSIENNTAFLWLSPAHSMISYLPIIQIADIGGSYIITAFVLYVSIFIFKIITGNKKEIKINIVLMGILIIFVLIYGNYRLSNNYVGNPINIAIVQPNIPGNIKESSHEYRIHRENTIKKYLSKIKDVDLTVFPETASPVYLQRSSKFQRYLKKYVKKNDTKILIGSLRLKYNKEKKKMEYFNSAYLINDSMEYYDKIRPLGFAERIPFDDKFTFLRKLPFGQGDFSPGKKFKIFDIDNNKLAVYICFESIFPTMAAKFVRNGAEFLINISEDVWFQGTIGPYQHFIIGLLRSVENRRYLLRASNPGISAIIDPHGKIIKKIDLYDSGIIMDTIKTNSKLTFYTKFDNIIPKLFILFLFIFYFKKYLWRHIWKK